MGREAGRGAALNRIKPSLQALLIAAASIALVTIGGVWRPVPDLPSDIPAPVRALVRWDGGWYGEIAQNGYWLHEGGQSPVAFFPLYPLAIRALTFIGVNRWVAGVLISLASALGALALFLRWAKKRQPEAAPWAFLLLALYPFSEYLYGVVYSDALFLLCAVGAFTAVEEDRPWLAALLGALATACRPVAPALVVGLVVRSLERQRIAGKRWRVRDFAPVLAGVGLAAYMGYLAWRFGDPLAFAHVQGAPGWDQEPGWRSWLKLSWFHTIFPKSAPEVAFRLIGHAVLTITALALVVPTWKRLGAGYALYCLIAVGLPAVSSKDFQGLGRYIIAAFPLFLTAAMLLAARPRLRLGVLAVSAGLLVFCAIALGAGGYVS